MDLFFWLSKLYEFIRFRFHRYPKFPLLHLPYLAIKQVIESMSVSERIKLSQTSKRMATFVRMRLPFYYVFIRDALSGLFMKDQNALLYCGREIHKFAEKYECLTSLDYEEWLPKNASNLKKTELLFHQIQDIFPSKSFGVCLFLSEIFETTIEKIFEIPAFQKCDRIVLYQGGIASIHLDKIMKMANDKRDIVIRYTVVAQDYRHEMAFKFRNIEYDDARWVRVEYLFSMNNCENVKIEQCRLNLFDINTLIKYWILCQRDMFKNLTIRFEKQDIEFDWNVVLKDVAAEKLDNSSFLMPASIMTSSSYDWIAYGQGFASGLLAVVSTGYIGYLATKYIQKKKRDVMLVDLHTSNVVLQGARVVNNPSNMYAPLMITVAYEQRGVLREGKE
ncbi:hypothetical protein GCK72_004445 [Caenorhabditis remanei]|uniref:F-box domain-containing protein n=1 Tax=Caenorhabditis remanei TaxID=31234 RepID=A0A6A5HBF3_CAERE|nr:hypothetical protein GCK72_004445 [Caenorhabditis remanei]KAF1764497.1 hypothetical protein GCK72_004445 [Caenorhabditis remanei]